MQKYRDAAILSAQFMQVQMLIDDIVMQVITLNATGPCQVDGTRLTAWSGMLIEGFSILADVSGDSAWRDQYAECPFDVGHVTDAPSPFSC